jgi:bla regulator protein BlaR1
MKARWRRRRLDVVTFKISGSYLFGSVALLALGGALTANPAHAQSGKLENGPAEQVQDSSQRIIPSVEIQQADVRDALRSLFREVGISYAIAPEVTGKVTASLRNVTFQSALENILRQVDATYRIESGVYSIIRREGIRFGSDPNPVSFIVRDPNVSSGITSDETYLYVIQGSRLFKVRKSDLRVVAHGNLEELPVFSLRLHRATAERAFALLTQRTGAQFSVAPDVRGTVTLDLRDVTFAEAFKRLLQEIGATYRIEGGTYHIHKG